MDEKKKLSKFVQTSFLAMTWISTMTCLVRTDYNFAFSLFSYYLFVARDDRQNTGMLMYINGGLLILDTIWLISIGEAWTVDIPGNDSWNQLYGIHVFAIILSVISCLLKLAIIVLLNIYRKYQEDDLNQPLNYKAGLQKKITSDN